MDEKKEQATIELDPGDPIAQAVRLEQRIGLAPGYILGLLREDDWSFVIKLQALVEAAVTHVLVAHLKQPNLERILARLELANKETGKMAFAKALGCIGDADRRFVRTLAEIRNRFAHDPKHVGSTLSAYVTCLDSDKFKNFVAAVGPGRNPVEIGDRSIPEAEFVRDNAKLAIWIAGVYMLAFAHLHLEQVDLEAKSDAIRRRLGETLFASPNWPLPLPRFESLG